MKKVLLIALATSSFSLSFAQQQIGNSGFETWQAVSGDEEPTNWNSFLTAGGGFAWAAANQIQQSSDVRPGSTGTKSCRIWSRSTLGIIANGNVTLGKINMGSTTPTNSSNYNASVVADANFSEALTDRPDSIVFWAKFTPNGHSQSARLRAALHTNNGYRDPEDATATTYLVASAVKNYPSTGGNWVRFSTPFTYSGPATVNTHILVTFTTNQTPGGGAANDVVLIDDVELIYVPKASFTSSGVTVCEGGSLNFTSTSTNYPTSYSWNFGDGTPNSTDQNPSHVFTTDGTYNVTLTATNQWGSTTSTATVVTVNSYADATFNYDQPSYCSNVINPTPVVVDAGTFTSTAGLSINSTTGVVNLGASTPATYIVTNTVGGACPDVATTSITITAAANSAFNYSSNTICMSEANPTPTTSEAGTFSSTSGLSFVSTSTGEIDLGASTAGTYTITYSVTGTCPSTTNVDVTLTLNPDATFTYSSDEYCSDAIDPAPVFGSGANGGVFSSTAGLSINSNSGVIDLSASTDGTYTVTNEIAAVGACPSSSETFEITVNALPNVTLGSFSDVCDYNASFSLAGGMPNGGSYSGNGVSTGMFNPATAGLGSHTITYSYTDGNNCSNTATNTIVVDACLSLEDNVISAVSVYPNPTNGILTVSNISEGTSFTIISTSGQVVLKGMLSETADMIDLSTIENGIYILQLNQSQTNQTIRIVKK